MTVGENISHQPDGRRFELSVDGHICQLVYSTTPEGVSFDSVRVPDAVGGQGLAGQLTRHALDWARSEKLKVRPTCPYVATWIQRHPDYADLVP